jgi:hypothetical protein
LNPLQLDECGASHRLKEDVEQNSKRLDLVSLKHESSDLGLEAIREIPQKEVVRMSTVSRSRLSGSRTRSRLRKLDENIQVATRGTLKSLPQEAGLDPPSELGRWYAARLSLV